MKAHMDHHAEENIEETELTRRNFLKMGLGALSALAALELGGVSLMFLKARSQEGKFGGEINIGAVELLSEWVGNRVRRWEFLPYSHPERWFSFGLPALSAPGMHGQMGGRKAAFLLPLPCLQF